MDELNLEALARDVETVIRRHGLTPDGFVVSISMSGRAFDDVANGHPDHVHPELMRKGRTYDSIQWHVQILRRRALEDFPPGAILAPPPDA